MEEWEAILEECEAAGSPPKDVGSLLYPYPFLPLLLLLKRPRPGGQVKSVGNHDVPLLNQRQRNNTDYHQFLRPYGLLQAGGLWKCCGVGGLQVIWPQTSWVIDHPQSQSANRFRIYFNSEVKALKQLVLQAAPLVLVFVLSLPDMSFTEPKNRNPLQRCTVPLLQSANGTRDTFNLHTFTPATLVGPRITSSRIPRTLRDDPPGSMSHRGPLRMRIVHGTVDHSGVYAELGAALAQHGVAVFASDMRGWGRSDGERLYVAPWPGWG